MNDSFSLRSPTFLVAAAAATLLVLLSGLRQWAVTAEGVSSDSGRIAQGPACLDNTDEQNQEIYFISCGGIY